jgi:hypothetical protein
MTTISQALEIVIGLVIFILIVFIFFKIFGSPECDSMANATAVELTHKISKVALGDDVIPWGGEGVPPDSETGHYAVVPIRLCERNFVNTLAATFAAQIPTYILTYETFPEPGSAWSESQPFSGGAASALTNYLFFKYGYKLPLFVGKIVKNAGGAIKSIFAKGVFDIIRFKWRNFVDKARDTWGIRWILRRFGSSSAGTTVPDDAIERLNYNRYPKEHLGILSVIKDLRSTGLKEELALADSGIFEEQFDHVLNEWVPKKDEAGKYIVKQKFASFMNFYIDNAADEAEKTVLKNIYYVPSRFKWLETLRVKVWRPLKYSVSSWIKNRWIYQKVMGIKEKYDDAKRGWNKIFNSQNYLDNADTPQEAAVVKRWAMFNRDEFTQEVANNFNEYKGPLEQITGKVFKDASDIADEDIIMLVSHYDEYFNSHILEKYVAREQEKVATQAFKSMGNKIKNEADKIADSAIPGVEWRKLADEWTNEFGVLPASEQTRRAAELTKGFTKTLTTQDAKIMHDYTRALMLKRGVLDSAKVIDPVTGEFKAKWFKSQMDKIKKEIFAGPLQVSALLDKSVISDFYLSPIVTESAYKAVAKNLAGYAWGRFKRAVWLETPRVGAVSGLNPYIDLSPWYNFPPSAYTAKEGLRRASEIQEGGCAIQSICKIEKGKVEGPTQTSTAYLLDRNVPDWIQVKLWRPKPTIGDRTPFGLQTWQFYNSVPENPRFHVISPCFGIAKIWKKGDTVYVNIDKVKKCDVSGCEQPKVAIPTGEVSFTIPYVNYNVNIPLNIPTPLGLSNIDTPNYCYASEEYIWGEDLSKGNLVTTGDVPSEITHMTVFGICVAGLTIATQGNIRAALKACSIGAKGALLVEAGVATEVYRNLPSWQRQETGWGYWNYQKATDLCDLFDLIENFGSFNVKKGLKANWLQSFAKEVGGNKYIKAVSSHFGPSDFCFAILMIGDTSLSWPIKTPVGEVWRKLSVLNENCMKTTASSCAWLNKCLVDNDCPSGQKCNIGLCKLSCSSDDECRSWQQICKGGVCISGCRSNDNCPPSKPTCDIPFGSTEGVCI